MAARRTLVKAPEVAENISFYEGDSFFTGNCGISLSGYTSLKLLKKSFKIHFRGCYGCKEIEYDLFDNGITTYDSLTIRAGQDNHNLIFQDELWGKLAESFSDRLLTQASKFAVVYVNGEYYGLAAIREDFSSQYYASHRSVSAESVQRASTPWNGSFFGHRNSHENILFQSEVLEFCKKNDLSDTDTYYRFCEIFDVDAYVDWMILEGISGNRDLFKNVAFFKSEENGGRWEIALFDLDAADPGRNFYNVFGYIDFKSREVKLITDSLIKNPSFVEKLLSRYAEVYNAELSNESILSLIDEYVELLYDEAHRDWDKWGFRFDNWLIKVEDLKSLITENDLQNKAVDTLLSIIGISRSENKYF